MKPGYQTTEFWVTLLSQALSVLVLLRVITPQDETTLGSALGNAVAAIFALLASAKVVGDYLRSRTSLKQGRTPQASQPIEDGSAGASPSRIRLGQSEAENTSAPPSGPNVLPAILLALVAWGVAPGQAPAAERQRTCLFGWRHRDANDEVVRLLREVAETQRLILQLLQEQRQRPTPPAALAAPQQPPIIVLGAPWQQVPLGGVPYQQIPLGGPPKQDIPLGPPPRQDVPLGPPPRQDVPLGGPPKQQIDAGAARPPASFTPPP